MLKRLTHEKLLEKLGMPLPTCDEEKAEAMERGVDLLLKTTQNKTGFKEVYPVKSATHPFQAKLYIRSGVQRQIAVCKTAREAAKQVLGWMLGEIDDPPTPPPRNKKGLGRRPRDRRKIPGVFPARRAVFPMCPLTDARAMLARIVWR